MRILIDALSARGGGALRALLQFVRHLDETDVRHTLDLLVSPRAAGLLADASRVRLHQPPRTRLGPAWRLYQTEVWLPRLIRRLRPAVVYTTGLLALPTDRPQLMRFAWPYALYPEALRWPCQRRDQLNRWARYLAFRRRLRHADLIVGQTETVAQRLRAHYPHVPRVEVVGNAVTPGPRAAPQPPNARWRLACVSVYYSHKNLEILLDVAELARVRGIALEFLLTLDRSEHPAAARLLEEIEGRGLQAYFTNFGRLSPDAVQQLYAECDAVILPTRLECFSAVYCDAMHHRRTLLTSDRDFAHDVCGEAAWTFDPLDAASILDTIEAARADPDESERRLDVGVARVAALPSWPEVCARYLTLLEELAG